MSSFLTIIAFDYMSLPVLSTSSRHLKLNVIHMMFSITKQYADYLWLIFVSYIISFEISFCNVV